MTEGKCVEYTANFETLKTLGLMYPHVVRITEKEDTVVERGATHKSSRAGRNSNEEAEAELVHGDRA